MKPNVYIDYDFDEELQVEAVVIIEHGKPTLDDIRVLFRGVDITAALTMKELLKIQERALEAYVDEREDRRAGVVDVFERIAKAGI